MFDFLLPKRMRMHRARDFKNVLAQRNRIYGNDYAICFTKNNIGFPRVALIASRRNVPLAVNRNRIKRIAREAFRVYQHSLGHYDFVIQVQKNANQSNNSELRQCIDELLEQFNKCRKS